MTTATTPAPTTNTVPAPNEIVLAVAGLNSVIKVKELLARGASAEEKDASGVPLLLCAAAHDNAEMIEVLIAAGAKVDDIDNCGFTALMVAAQNGAEHAAEALLQARADITLRTDGKTALDFAEENGNGSVAELIRGKMYGAALKADLSGPIRLIAEILEGIDQDESIGKMKGYLAEGDKLDEPNIENATALMFAIGFNCPKIVRFLLDQGASLEVKNSLNETPVKMAQGCSNEATKEMVLTEAKVRADRARNALVEERQEAMRTRAPKLRIRMGGP
jgi:ankyrin repeat protein